MYRLDSDKELKMWHEAIFVFDSSALLGFYYLPFKERVKIYDLFSKNLKNRIWIPHHVLYEYEKNREEVILKPISEKYNPLKKNIFTKIKESVDNIINRIEELDNTTKRYDKHPHLNPESIQDFKLTTQHFKDSFINFENKVSQEINLIEEEITSLKDNDDLKAIIENSFFIGREYSFDEIMEITKEGKHRYEFSIPPGYEDAKTKKGTQVFGDLIIWKQILEIAKTKNKPIIFICNDIKEDWCKIEKNNFQKKIKNPREELIKEIYDYANIDFWIYDQPEFLYKSNTFFRTKIEDKNIENLSKAVLEEEVLIIKCSNCGKSNYFDQSIFNFDEFECVSTLQKGIELVNEYHLYEYEECYNCNNEFTIVFKIWEYPTGIQEHEEIDVKKGVLIKSIDFTTDLIGE
ncbi:PIN-like domain-containing protein [Flavobacterium rhizosphaerae]|uniref:PIN-like domain-containing protein n=1 Tax=Flavobacterium rhizosphaerae TaxID=3163298 RepID=A0ABW8YU67_9FLAO